MAHLCQERLWVINRMESLGAHTTKQTPIAQRSVGICTRTLKIRLAGGNKIERNGSLMPDVQKLQTVVVREDLVERIRRRCLPRSCLLKTRTHQDRVAKIRTVVL
jgi:hypothetical protein